MKGKGWILPVLFSLFVVSLNLSHFHDKPTKETPVADSSAISWNERQWCHTADQCQAVLPSCVSFVRREREVIRDYPTRDSVFHIETEVWLQSQCHLYINLPQGGKRVGITLSWASYEFVRAESVPTEEAQAALSPTEPECEALAALPHRCEIGEAAVLVTQWPTLE